MSSVACARGSIFGDLYDGGGEGGDSYDGGGEVGDFMEEAILSYSDRHEHFPLRNVGGN